MASSLTDLRLPLTSLLLLLLLSFLCAFPHELLRLSRSLLVKFLHRLLGGFAFLCASAAIAVFSIFNSLQDSVPDAEDEVHVSGADGLGFVRKVVFSMEIDSTPSASAPPFEVGNAVAEKEMEMARVELRSGISAMEHEKDGDDDGGDRHIIGSRHGRKDTALLEKDEEDKPYPIENSLRNVPWPETATGAMKTGKKIEQEEEKRPHILGFQEHGWDEDEGEDRDGEHNIIEEEAHCCKMNADEPYATARDLHCNAAKKKKKRPHIQNALGMKEHGLEDGDDGGDDDDDDGDAGAGDGGAGDGDNDEEDDDDGFDDLLNAMVMHDDVDGAIDASDALMTMMTMVEDEDALDDALVHEINKHGAHHGAEMRDMMVALMSPRELGKQADAFIARFKAQMRMQQMRSWKLMPDVLICSSSASNMRLESHGSPMMSS